MTSVINYVPKTVESPVISKQVFVMVATVTFMVIVATFHVPLHAIYKQRHAEVYVSRQMVNVCMGVLLAFMVYSVLRYALFIATMHFVTNALANVQKVAKLEKIMTLFARCFQVKFIFNKVQFCIIYS
jgi:hypothetical protein